jgi:hypothetical protein
MEPVAPPTPPAPAAPPRLGLISALVGLAAAAPYLGNGPVWDDHGLITDGLAQVPLDALPQLLTQPVGGGVVGQGYYRPVAMLALALVGRLGVPAVHALAALCHAASAALLSRLIGVWAVIFAIHPLLGEQLGWASALPDALALALALGAAAAATRGGVGWAGGALLALAAMLSKEVALVLVPAAALLSGVERRGAAALGLGLGLGLALRLGIGASGGWDLDGKLGLAPLALASAWSLPALPFPVDPLRDLHGLGAGRAALGFGVLAVALLLALRSPRARAAAGLLLFVGGPVLALPPTLHGWLAAERYAVPALLGLLCLLPAPQVPARPALLLLAAPVALALHLPRAAVWSGDVPLFTAAVQAAPTSAYAWRFLGEAYALEGDLSGAASAFREAFSRSGEGRQERARLVEALVRAGQPTEALVIAEGGPTDGLEADELAWWAAAAEGAGQPARARALLAPLAAEGGWAGPPFVPALAERLGLGVSTPPAADRVPRLAPGGPPL